MTARGRTVREGFCGGVPSLVRFLTLASLIGGLIGGMTNFVLLPGCRTQSCRLSRQSARGEVGSGRCGD